MTVHLKKRYKKKIKSLRIVSYRSTLKNSSSHSGYVFKATRKQLYIWQEFLGMDIYGSQYPYSL